MHIDERQHDGVYDKRDNIIVYVIGRVKRSAEGANGERYGKI